jgi:hypothetical protein
MGRAGSCALGRDEGDSGGSQQPMNVSAAWDIPPSFVVGYVVFSPSVSVSVCISSIYIKDFTIKINSYKIDS